MKRDLEVLYLSRKQRNKGKCHFLVSSCSKQQESRIVHILVSGIIQTNVCKQVFTSDYAQDFHSYLTIYSIMALCCHDNCYRHCCGYQLGQA